MKWSILTLMLSLIACHFPHQHRFKIPNFKVPISIFNLNKPLSIFQSVICIFHCSGWEIEELLSPPSRPYPVDSYILVAYSLKVLLSDCYVQIQNLEDLKVSGGDPVVPSPLRNWPRLTCLHERYQTMSTAKSQVLPNQECYQTTCYHQNTSVTRPRWL